MIYTVLSEYDIGEEREIGRVHQFDQRVLVELVESQLFLELHHFLPQVLDDGGNVLSGGGVLVAVLVQLPDHPLEEPL